MCARVRKGGSSCNVIMESKKVLGHSRLGYEEQRVQNPFFSVLSPILTSTLILRTLLERNDRVTTMCRPCMYNSFRSILVH